MEFKLLKVTERRPRTAQIAVKLFIFRVKCSTNKVLINAGKTVKCFLVWEAFIAIKWDYF